MSEQQNTQQPVPRDVLMEFGATVRDACSFAVSGDIGVRSADKVMAGVDIAAIADRYASQVRSEPVNQDGVWVALQPGVIYHTPDDKLKMACVVGGHLLVNGMEMKTAIIPPCSTVQAVPHNGEKFFAAMQDAAPANPTTKPEPVNRQTLAALKDCVEDSRQVLAQDEQIYSESYRPHRLEYQRKVVANAEAAIAAAEAAQPDHIVDTDKMVSTQPVAVPDGWDAETVRLVFSTLRYIIGLQPSGKKTPSEHLQDIIDKVASWSDMGPHHPVRKQYEAAAAERAMLSAAQKTEGV